MKVKKNAFMKAGLGSLALLGILSIADLQCAATAPPPPAEPVVVVPARPHPHAVWVPGHWAWKRWHHRHVWVPGHWQVRRGHRWVIVR